MIWLGSTVIITTKEGKSYSNYKRLFYSRHGQLSTAFPNLFFLCPNPFILVSLELKIVSFKMKLFWIFPQMLPWFQFLNICSENTYTCTDLQTDTEMYTCAHMHVHMHTHTDRHAEQTEIHTDTDIYPQTYSGPDARMLSVIQCGVLFPQPLYKRRSDRTTAMTMFTVFLVSLCHKLKGIFKYVGKCDGM